MHGATEISIYYLKKRVTIIFIVVVVHVIVFIVVDEDVVTVVSAVTDVTLNRQNYGTRLYFNYGPGPFSQ